MYLSNLEELYKYDKKGVISNSPGVLSFTMRNNLSYAIGRDKGFKNHIRWGGYNCAKGSKTDSLLKVLKYDESNMFEIAEQNLWYLSNIINQCNRIGVKVVLVRYPIHTKCIMRNNEQYFQDIRTSRYGNVEFLDFVDFPLSNKEFGDLQHLNHRGATKFSIFFNELLENGLLDKEDKQAFIEGEMVKFDSKYYTEKVN